MVHKKVRHSREDALSQRKFQLLLEGASNLDDYYGQQARFLVLVMGRLGLRRGEVAHLKESWIAWRRNMIEIPLHQSCEKGRDGGICGYCRLHAKQRVDHNPDMEMDQAEDMAWIAKTEAASRDVPFDFNPRVTLVIERFFDKYDEWPCSSQSISRRINAAAEAANEIHRDTIYPHALRATAATYHAARGLDVIPLQSLMGWAQVKTAHNYIQKSGENTARALHYTHSQ